MIKNTTQDMIKALNDKAWKDKLWSPELKIDADSFLKTMRDYTFNLPDPMSLQEKVGRERMIIAYMTAELIRLLDMAFNEGFEKRP